MTNPEIILPGYYLRQLVDQVAESGVAVEGWLEHIGFGNGRLDTAELSLTLVELRQLVSEALSLSREPALGLLLGARLQANTHGILGYAAMSGGSIREVIGLLERFITLRTSLVALDHAFDGNEMILRFRETVPLAEIRAPILEAVVLAIRNVLDFVTFGSCQISRAAFPFPASAGQAALARELFRCPVIYNQDWAGFALPVAVLDQPLRMADPAAFQEAARLCAQELGERHSAQPLAARVRRLLLEKQSDFPSLAVTARLFHVTPRTLHRRLEAEGTSFQQVLEGVRHALALEYLRAGRLTVQEIAYTLGYTDIANFRRAFKRWEGRPPSALRPSENGGRGHI